MKTIKDFEFKLMMREDNFEVLTKCAPKASHRLLEIISEAYNADFPDDAALEELFSAVEKKESGKFPTRWRLQVIGSLNHVKMLLKSHYKYRYEAYRNLLRKK